MNRGREKRKEKQSFGFIYPVLVLEAMKATSLHKFLFSLVLGFNITERGISFCILKWGFQCFLILSLFWCVMCTNWLYHKVCLCNCEVGYVWGHRSRGQRWLYAHRFSGSLRCFRSNFVGFFKCFGHPSFSMFIIC